MASHKQVQEWVNLYLLNRYNIQRLTSRSMSQQKPGWYNVPGKGRRYWNGSNYQFFGPSDNPASRGQPSVSGDIGGMWNNFVNQWGSSTKDPSRVGEQSFTRQQVEQVRSRRRNVGAKPDSPEAPTSPEPTATAQPPKEYTVSGVTYNTNTGRPKGAPEGGYSLETDGTMTPHSGGSGGSGGSEPRVNREGLLSYGRDLSSLNQFTREFTGGYEIADVKTAFQSEKLPATAAGVVQLEQPYIPGASPTQKPNVSSTDEPSLPYGTQLPEGTEPFAPTTPYKTGGNPSDPQDGTSDAPDIADNVRTIRQSRRGRGVNGADFSGDEPDNSSLVSPMYANSKRNAIRDAFLDPSKSSVRASVAANALAHYGKDSNGQARFNVGGKLVYARDGMQQQAKNAAMMGQDPSPFLDLPTTPDVEPDSPATTELSPAFNEVIPEANDFFRSKLKEIKEGNK